MAYYLTLSNTYDLVQIGLFDNGHLVDSISDDKLYVSKNIILLINNLLTKNNKKLSDLSFIAANQGPAPYTTLRVVLSTVNGISFSSAIPLIGLDGLELFSQEYADHCYPQTVILSNAFNQEVYYALVNNQGIIKKGYGTIKSTIDFIHNQFPTNTIRFLGNGYQLHKTVLDQVFESRIVIPQVIPTHPSLSFLGTKAYEQWQNIREYSFQLLPLYLKQVQIF
ncbi:MAG: tRNA (adenosine(37)-N6)-threonylcarbamoyltransferase complex dimerization subunit type 1 TsaB [Candidatus Dependentiae bacterium]